MYSLISIKYGDVSIILVRRVINRRNRKKIEQIERVLIVQEKIKKNFGRVPSSGLSMFHASFFFILKNCITALWGDFN